MKIKKTGITLLILFILLIINGFLYGYINKNVYRPRTNIITTKNTNTDIKREDQKNIDGNLYFLKNEEKCFFFLRGQKYGLYVENEPMCHNKEVDITSVEKQKVLLLKSDNNSLGFGDHLYSIKEQGDFIYFGIDVRQIENDNVVSEKSEFYQLNKKTNSLVKILSSDNKEINTTEDKRRAWLLDSISNNNNAISLKIYSCLGCEGEVIGEIIYNLTTKNWKIINSYVTDFEFTSENKFKYKTVKPIGPCDSLGGCFEDSSKLPFIYGELK